MGVALRTWSKGGIQHVNVDANVDARVFHSLAEAVDDAPDADKVNVSGRDDVEAAVLVVAHVGVVDDLGADTSMDGRVENQVLN